MRPTTEEKRLQKELAQCSKELCKQDEKVKQLAEENKMLLEALNKVQGDINWMTNEGKVLNRFVFDYIDQAIAKAEGRGE